MHETARCLFNILSWLSHRLIKYNSLFLSSFIKLHFIVLLIYLINSEQLALDFTNMRNPVLNIFLTYLSILDSYLIGINLTIGASSSNFYQYVSIYQFVSMCINKPPYKVITMFLNIFSCAGHYISVSYLLYNWKFVTLNLLHLCVPFQHTLLPFANQDHIFVVVQVWTLKNSGFFLFDTMSVKEN